MAQTVKFWESQSGGPSLQVFLADQVKHGAYTIHQVIPTRHFANGRDGLNQELTRATAAIVVLNNVNPDSDPEEDRMINAAIDFLKSKGYTVTK